MSDQISSKLEAVTEAEAKQWMFFFVCKRGGASVLRSLVCEAPKQCPSNPYPESVTGCFGGVLQRSIFEAGNLGGNLPSKIEAVTEAEAKQSGVSKDTHSTDYAEKLLKFATQSPKQVQDKVSLPIPEGVDLPDLAKILRAAYDLWQPVRDAMPEWIAYMSVRKAHQDGDKSLEKAHRDAEQAYYDACQQCPEFQYYRQVHQRLFPPSQEKLIDWYAAPQEASL